MIKQVEVFEFNELSEEVKAKLMEIAKEQMIIDRFDNLYENLLYFLKDTKGIEVEDDALRYSLSCCQGDGLNFKMDDMHKCSYFIDKVKEILSPVEKAMLTKLLKAEAFMIHSTGNTGRYYFHSTEDVDFEINDTPTTPQLHLIKKVTDEVSELYCEVCSELEKIGYGVYDIPDEEVEEYCDACENLYFKDGEIADYYLIEEERVITLS